MPQDAKRIVLQARVEERLRGDISKLAKKKGVSMADYVRMVLIEHVATVKKAAG